MNIGLIRIAVAVAVWWFASGREMPSIPGLDGETIHQAKYTGSMTELHGASRKMSAETRKSLSDTLSSAATMIESDRAGAIKTTDQLQAAIKATVAFGHTAFQGQRYPAVAEVLQWELEQAVGGNAGELSQGTRTKTVAVLRESSKAVR